MGSTREPDITFESIEESWEPSFEAFGDEDAELEQDTLAEENQTFNSEETEELRKQLLREIEDHKHTFARMKSLEQKLRKMDIAMAAARKAPEQAKLPDPEKRFGITDPAPYAVPPPAIPKVQSPPRKGVNLSNLKAKAPSSKQQGQEADPTGANVADFEAAVLQARAAALQPPQQMSRAEQSRSRLEVIKQLDKLGMNTWEVRAAEKVSRLRDMNTFGNSMWHSFNEWQDASNAVA